MKSDIIELMIQSLLEEQGLVCEKRWIEEEFIVWVSYQDLPKFMETLAKMIGYDSFADDGGFDCKLQNGGVCFDFVPFTDCLGVDLVDVFPKDETRIKK